VFDFTNKSVAIVGSSGHLLERDYAQKIDNHDIIIRFNQARVKGYEEYVGTKTTFRIVNTHTFLGTSGSGRFTKNDPNFIPNLKDQIIIINRPVPKSDITKRSPNNPVVIAPDSIWDVCKKMLGKDPSVGFLGVTIALQTTQNISVFGFDQSPTTNNKHYWEEVKYIGGWHNFNIEKQKFKELEEEKVIKIFK
jgi:hypothetical protein